MVVRRHGIDRASLYPHFRQPFRDPFKKAVQIAVGRRIRRKQAFMQLNIDGAARSAVRDFIGRGNVHFRIGKGHPIGQHGLMAKRKLLRRDQNIFITGKAVIGIGINTPADDAFDNAGPDARLPQFFIQSEKFTGLLRLEHDHLNSAPFIRGKKIRFRFPGRRAVVNRVINQGQNIMHFRQLKERKPLLRFKLLLPSHFFIFKGGPHGL